MFIKKNLVNAKKHWQLYLIIALPVLYFLIFKYLPMYGITLAFKKYRVSKGILGSPWIGFENFIKFFSNPSAIQIMINTLIISLYGLLTSIPLAVILAISLNEMKNQKFKKSVQMITYAPYFISTVVMVAMIMQFLDPSMGIINTIANKFGISSYNYMGKQEAFRHIYIFSGLWQSTGYNAIIYLAALSAISPELYEASKVDGINKWQKIFYIDLPSIKSTIVVMFIMNMGYIMSLGFEKIYLMQNPLNLGVSEIMSTYVYKMGIINSDYGYSTAIGLINSLINLVLIVLFNYIARKKAEGTSLW